MLYSSKATASVKAVRTDNAIVYAVSNVGKSKVDATADGSARKALQGAGKEAGADIFAKIVKKWNEEKDKGAQIEIALSGMSFGTLRKLVAVLKDAPGTEDVIERSFNAPAAVLSVTSKVSAMELATFMDEQEFEGFDIEVTSVTAGRIEARVK